MHHIVVVVICSETLLSTLSDRLEWYPPQPESGRNPSLIQTQILPDISIIDFGDPPPPSKFDNTLLHLHVSVLITVANYPPAVYFCWIEGRLGDQGWKEKIAFICLCIVNFSSLCIGNFSPLCIINFSSAPKGGKTLLNSPLSKQCNLTLQPKIHNACLTKMWLLSTS